MFGYLKERARRRTATQQGLTSASRAEKAQQRAVDLEVRRQRQAYEAAILEPVSVVEFARRLSLQEDGVDEREREANHLYAYNPHNSPLTNNLFLDSMKSPGMALREAKAEWEVVKADCAKGQPYTRQSISEWIEARRNSEQ